VAANLDISKVPEMKVDNLKSSIVVNVDGRKVGIVGYVTTWTKTTTPENNAEFDDEVEAVK
jgi:2',3'-cyclic-nucleotide 2'-phosphodiesterase (5'-nucleotidase family)